MLFSASHLTKHDLIDYINIMVKILTDERINKSLEAARTKAALQAELETVRFEKSIEAARTKAILQASTVTRHGPQTQSTEDDLTETFEVSRAPPPLAAYAFDTVSRPCPDFHPVTFFFFASPLFMKPWPTSATELRCTFSKAVIIAATIESSMIW